MRRFICGMMLMAGFVSFCACLSGCGDKGNVEKDYDAKASEKKSAEYSKEMEEAMKNVKKDGG